MNKDPEVRAHLEWLGYVQPEGLVVSIPALLEARAYLNRNFAPEHRRFLDALQVGSDAQPVPEIRDFPAFAEAVFGWTAQDLYGSPGAPEIPASLEATLPEYGETLRPTYAVPEFQPRAPNREWIMLVQMLPRGTDFDRVHTVDQKQWQASPQSRLERLLRQTKVSIGLLVNERQIRLVYAPEKELSGHITFNLADMVTVAGRPIFAAMHMLLCADRLFGMDEKERLPAILANSRKYQNLVSTQLAEQVVEALYELLRGFQGANDQSVGELLREVLASDPDHVYRGLLTVLLRMVFLLFAEDRNLLSSDPLYLNHYSVTGLYERLREDHGRYAELMDQRYGAWAQLLVLFRLIYSGGAHGAMRIPAREGYLFDPDRYLFLEGRSRTRRAGGGQSGTRCGSGGRTFLDAPDIPRVSDGVLFRVLQKLMVLDGERLSYKTLAVEQIGSVYQAIMGFGLQVATGRSIAIKPTKKHGAPATIDLEELLATTADKRAKWFAEATDHKLTGQAVDALKSASTVEELLVALEKARKIATAVTPNPVPKGAMIFQATDERRRSGSHYTPTSLTRPIVEAALEPVLKQLGENPTPAQILNLKVCDLAMGSAAFLVEACRQLGDALVKAWHAHNEVLLLPPDEDEALAAMRQVAQRCIYGLDKNPMATDLAKLSLWLATLAKDHPFTFLDHSLRSGDALVGLTRQQIAAFNWQPTKQQMFIEERLRERIGSIAEGRRKILAARDALPYSQLQQELAHTDDLLSLPRMIGDAAIAAFFSSEKPKVRQAVRQSLLAGIEADLKKQGFISLGGEVDHVIAHLRGGSKGLLPFHWDLEFPELFTVDQNGNVNGGFDVIVGNPPFLGGRRTSTNLGDAYSEWLSITNEESSSNADLAAFFFRRAFKLLRNGGTFGLIATNTISQGDTRNTGLRWLKANHGFIFSATKRLEWPGQAAVIVSVIHVSKMDAPSRYLLDGKTVEKITAYLAVSGIDDSPKPLRERHGSCFQGVIPLGIGFTFDDDDSTGKATSLEEMRKIIDREPHNADRIFSLIGGEEVLGSPTHAVSRYVIDFADMSLEEAGRWPTLLRILEQKVRPDRVDQKRQHLREWWWQFAETRPALRRAIAGKTRVLMHPFTSTFLAFVFVPTNVLVAGPHQVFSLSADCDFAILQSRVHELWARFFASSLKDDLRYTPSECFETFPFPENWDSRPLIEAAGKAYYESRASLMVRNNQGLTKTYNRFHNPHEDDEKILQLRELHDLMDRAVLDAYGWTDIQPKCEFIPEFEDEDDEDESGRPRKKKYRYRWPDEIRDEVLARLLELNRQRALEEGQMIATEPPKAKKKTVPKSAKHSKAKMVEALFGDNTAEE